LAADTVLIIAFSSRFFFLILQLALFFLRKWAKSGFSSEFLEIRGAQNKRCEKFSAEANPMFSRNFSTKFFPVCPAFSLFCPILAEIFNGQKGSDTMPTSQK